MHGAAERADRSFQLTYQLLLEIGKINYRLTAHAEKTIAERGISRSWVARVLSNPVRIESDKEDETLRHALGRIPERGDRLLRVIYNHTVTPWAVITAFFDRKAGKAL